MTDAASVEPWDGTFIRRIADATVRGPLSAALAPGVIDAIRRFGFALVASAPSELSPGAIAARADELRSLGTALGRPLYQSARREFVEDVKNYSDVETGDDRGYRSGGELTAHSDPPTLIMLHCVQPAREGGESSLVSVASIVDRMDRVTPGLSDELFSALPDWRVPNQYGIAEPGPAAPRPVLARHNGTLSCVIYRPYIEKGAEATGVTLSSRQMEALDLFETASMSADLTMRFTLAAGQTLVLHNRSVLHARTDFSDWPELHRRRHLLRMWIDAPETFPVHPAHELGDLFPV